MVVTLLRANTVYHQASGGKSNCSHQSTLGKLLSDDSSDRECAVAFDVVFGYYGAGARSDCSQGISKATGFKACGRDSLERVFRCVCCCCDLKLKE